jgi:hypothetical protein
MSKRGFKSRTELRIKDRAAYNALIHQRPEILDKVYPIKLKKPHGYWTVELCLKSALKYKTPSEWRKREGGAYVAAGKHNCIKQCTKHMTKRQKPAGHWNLTRCLKSAKKYETIKEWRIKEPVAAAVAYKRGWAKRCTKRMTRLIKPKNYWTKEKCLKSALNYRSVKEWRKGETSAYSTAWKNGWFEQCSKHFISAYEKRIINLDTKIMYDSVVKGAQSVNRGATSLHSSLKNGYKCGGYRWAYYDEKAMK